MLYAAKSKYNKMMYLFSVIVRKNRKFLYQHLGNCYRLLVTSFRVRTNHKPQTLYGTIVESISQTNITYVYWFA
jgi:hypothetical protein